MDRIVKKGNIFETKDVVRHDGVLTHVIFIERDFDFFNSDENRMEWNGKYMLNLDWKDICPDGFPHDYMVYEEHVEKVPKKESDKYWLMRYKYA